MSADESEVGQKSICSSCGRKCTVKAPDLAFFERRRANTDEALERLRSTGERFGDPYKFDLVKIVGPKTTCEICSKHVGQVYSISGTNPNYPPLDLIDGVPPFHPNCCHNLAPFIEELNRDDNLFEP